MDLNDKHVIALRNCLEVQERDEGKEGWNGMLWSEVRTPAVTLNYLVTQGLLDLMDYSSRQYKYYKVNDKAEVRRIIDAYSEGEIFTEEDDDILIPHDLFDIIVGLDQTKNLLKMSLAASDPVHVLLEGEPATAKTLFLTELARLPGSRLALGGTSSRAGIVDFLIDAKPRYLIIDEIEKMDARDMDVLLSLMETGLVTRLKRGMREQIKLRTWVFAGANVARYISRAMLSRFVVRHMQVYSQSEFEAISRAILIKREKLDPAWADKIITALQGKTIDPRDSVKVGRLLQDLSQLDEVIDTIWS